MVTRKTVITWAFSTSMLFAACGSAHAGPWTAYTFGAGTVEDINNIPLPWGGTAGTAAGLGAILYNAWDNNDVGHVRSELISDFGFGIETQRAIQIQVNAGPAATFRFASDISLNLTGAVPSVTPPGPAFLVNAQISQPVVTVLGPAVIQSNVMSRAEANVLATAIDATTTVQTVSQAPDNPVKAAAEVLESRPGIPSPHSVGPIQSWGISTEHFISFDSGVTFTSIFDTLLAKRLDGTYLVDDDLDVSLFDFVSGEGVAVGALAQSFNLAPGTYNIVLKDVLYGFLDTRRVPEPAVLSLLLWGVVAFGISLAKQRKHGGISSPG